MNSDQFNKQKAFDEFTVILGTPPKTPSDFMNMIKKAQDYLQGIYDQGFQDGFSSGTNADVAIKKLNNDDGN